jgi:hypothetical protein
MARRDIDFSGPLSGQNHITLGKGTHLINKLQYLTKAYVLQVLTYM